MALKFKTKIDTRLGSTDDAMSVLRTAVNNGQARLAMEVLVDVLDGIIGILESIGDTDISNTKDQASQRVSPVEDSTNVQSTQEENFQKTKSAPKKKAPAQKAGDIADLDTGETEEN